MCCIWRVRLRPGILRTEPFPNRRWRRIRIMSSRPAGTGRHIRLRRTGRNLSALFRRPCSIPRLRRNCVSALIPATMRGRGRLTCIIRLSRLTARRTGKRIRFIRKSCRARWTEIPGLWPTGTAFATRKRKRRRLIRRRLPTGKCGSGTRLSNRTLQTRGRLCISALKAALRFAAIRRRLRTGCGLLPTKCCR